MNLEKAIEKLKDLKRYAYEPETQKAVDALELGIEALKRLIENRRDNPETAWQLLPGETEEDANE